jgi:cell division protein FtsW
MMSHDKTIFALLSAALLGVGFSLTRFAPVVMTPRQGFWFALECLVLLSLFFLKEYRADTKVLRALAASRGTSWAFLLAALVLDFAVLAFGEHFDGARRYLFLGGLGFRVSPVSFLLVVAFISLRLRQKTAGNFEFLAILAALAGHFFILARQPNTAMFYIQLACLFTIGLFGMSKRKQKILLMAAPVVFVLSLVLMFLGSLSLRERISAWLAPASDPYMGYQYAQMLKAFKAAGYWGAENAAVFQSRLISPQDPTLNALPHLSLLWGNAATAACVALLLALMLILLRRIARLENPVARNGAFGVWLFLAFMQLGGVSSPLALLPLSSSWGVAFIGSQSLGALLLLLAAGLLGRAGGGKRRNSGLPAPRFRLAADNATGRRGLKWRTNRGEESCVMQNDGPASCCASARWDSRRPVLLFRLMAAGRGFRLVWHGIDVAIISKTLWVSE